MLNTKYTNKKIVKMFPGPNYITLKYHKILEAIFNTKKIQKSQNLQKHLVSKNNPPNRNETTKCEQGKLKNEIEMQKNVKVSKVKKKKKKKIK